MKKQFILILAALLLSSCASSGAGNNGVTEISDTVSAEATVTTSETVSSVTTTVTKETTRETTTVTTTAVMEETTLRESEPLPIEQTVLADYLTEDGDIPIDLAGKEVYYDGVCLETIDGVPYEDFPAKEDIPAAIETAFENFFKDNEVWHMDNPSEPFPCFVENLRFDSGLYLDFDGNGEKESLIVIKDDSDVPFARNSAVVYCNGENNTLLFSGEGSSIYLHALVYSDCINLIVEQFFGAAGQASDLYTYNGGFNKVWALGKGDLCSEGNRILSSPWYDVLGGDLPHYLFYNSEKKTYELVGMDELTREELTKKLPEMSLLCQGIEEMYGKEITKIETEGWINFYFHLDDEYVRAYILNGSLYLMTGWNFGSNLHDNGERFGLDIAYGLFLPGEFDQSEFVAR